jgi:type I restriction enzyme, S subunit
VREGWQVKPIGDVFRVVNGGTPKTGVATYWDGPHAWITPAEMGGLESPFISISRRTLTEEGLRVGAEVVPPGSIILSTRAPIGHLVINEVPMAFNQGCKGLIPATGVESKFAYYFLLANVPLLDSLGTGATFKELSASKLKEVLFHFPAQHEQRRIVAILDEAFEGIATAKAHAERNFQNVREVFSAVLASFFPSSRAEVTLVELADSISDGDHAPPPKAKDGVPFITISNIDKAIRQIDFADTFLVPRSYFDGLKAHRRPVAGDVLYTVTGSFGIPVLVTGEQEFCFQRHIGLIRPKPTVDAAWLTYALLSPMAFAQADQRATGTAQRTVSLSVLRDLRLPRLPADEQRRVAAEIATLESRTRELEDCFARKLAALDELKQSLLHQAFSGQL